MTGLTSASRSDRLAVRRRTQCRLVSAISISWLGLGVARRSNEERGNDDCGRLEPTQQRSGTWAPRPKPPAENWKSIWSRLWSIWACPKFGMVQKLAREGGTW